MDSLMKEFEHLRISLEEIKRVTNEFSNKHIGFGGFGKVYGGELSHSKGRSQVAIKRLELDSKSGQGNPEFWREIMMLFRYSHDNLIPLLGFCDEAGEKVIVTELASNGSLDRHLSSPDLTWEQRIKICLGAAQGLSYLHDDKGTHQRVIHRDVKSSNILLDDEWKAKVSDMGLAKVGPANQEHTALLTNVVGTPGYVDPVYLETGVLKKESDVYSFGIVLFEVLCGRPCFSQGLGNLVRTWKQSYKNKKIHEILFQDLTLQPMDITCLEIFSEIAFRCVRKSHEERPTMSHVVERLEMALQFQKRLDLNLPEEYVNILKAVGTPLRFNSSEELKLVLSNGLFLDAGKTWLSINEKEEHYVLISMDACLIREAGEDYEYSTEYNSRFPVGTYSADDDFVFKTRVSTRFLSPNITYIVNLVFKKRYNASDDGFKRVVKLRYKLREETKAWTPHLADEREDGWYTIELYQFTSDGATPVDLDIIFEVNAIGLELEGIEFQPTENVDMQPPLSCSDDDEESQVSDDEKQVDIIEPPLSCSDDDEKSQVSHDEKQVDIEPSSCSDDDEESQVSDEDGESQVSDDEQQVDIEPTSSDDNEESQFSDEDEESQVLDDEQEVDIEPPLSSSGGDTYWEQQLPDDHQDIIKLSKDRVEWETKRELYKIFRKGFLINYGSFFERLFKNGQQLFFLDKTGKKCLMLSARAAFKVNKIRRTSWSSSPKQIIEVPTRTANNRLIRFDEMLMIHQIDRALFQNEIKYQVLSPLTKYACYLVYKIDDTSRSNLQRPVSVRDKYAGSDNWDKSEYWHIYLVSPQTPVIRPKVGENTHNPLFRPKIVKGIPRQKSGDWMEVQVYEFQTSDTTKGVIPSLELKFCVDDGYVGLGLVIHGVSVRPI